MSPFWTFIEMIAKKIDQFNNWIAEKNAKIEFPTDLDREE